MQNLLNELKEALEKDESLVIDGRLNKALIEQKALALDKGLLKLLISSDMLYKHFFEDVDGTLVFDKVKFQQFVQNKSFLPDSYTAFKNKIGLTSSGDYLSKRSDVVLAWPHKDCVLQGGQDKEDAKRDEIFWNETLAPDDIDRLLAPKVFTNWKKYDKDGEQAVEKPSLKDNYLIKGNNLLALQSLAEVYRGKVKLIYIDPPYNTGGDANVFSYNNTFNHSTWLTFIKNRLEIAHELLSHDGFIAIAIDHAELFYLGVLADQVFGRENRIAIVTIVHNPKGRNQAKFFSENSDFMLVYAKNKNQASFNQVAIDEDVLITFTEEDEKGRFRWENMIRARTVWSRENRPKNWYPIYVSKDLKDITSEYHDGYHELYPTTEQGEFAWKVIKPSFEELNKEPNYFRAIKDADKIILQHKYYEQQVYKNVWTKKKYQSEFHGTNLLKKLIGKTKFSYPKSLYTVLDTIKIMTKPGDLILDFFGGSATTAHAVIEVNKNKVSGDDRKFILVEQLDEHVDVAIRRLTKLQESESDNFNFVELKKANQLWVDEIQAAENEKALTAIWEKMKEKAFISYKVNPKVIDENAEEFSQLSLDDQKRFLIEVLDKNLLYVNYSEMDDADYAVSEKDKELNRAFYGLKK